MIDSGITDINWNTIVLAIIGGVNSILLAIIGSVGGYFIARASKAADKAAVQAEEVKETLADSLTKTTDTLRQIKTTGEITHQLVNGSLTAQMKLTAVALRRVADVTKDPDDVTAADLAEKAMAEHIAKQPAKGETE
jgi:Xaa-Pro aminopeptidase